MNRSYEPYSDDPDYIAGNRAFIAELDLRAAERLLDLACGIGTLSRLVMEGHPELVIVGVDLSLEGLVIGRKRLPEANVALGAATPALVCATADALPLSTASMDAVLMGHSIHMLPDVDRLLGEVGRVLRPGGTFAFNTSFYAGTFPTGTEAIYHDWVKIALNVIRDKDADLRRAGKPGIRRIKGKAAPAFSRGWLTEPEWRDTLARCGFEVNKVSQRTVPLTRYSFETIGSYAGFAEVMLSGYPVEVSCEALEVAAGPVFQAAGVEQVPRNWLEVVAVKR